jgi:tripartite-type tricarboxylate transporter receptor subunit TctC
MFDPIVSSLGYIKAGQLRALGVTGATRLPTLPGVPTVGETVPGFDVTGAIGIGAPLNTPAEVVGYLNDKVNAALADSTIKARLVDLGFVPTPMSAVEFGTFMAAETEQWAKVIQAANIKPE